MNVVTFLSFVGMLGCGEAPGSAVQQADPSSAVDVLPSAPVISARRTPGSGELLDSTALDAPGPYAIAPLAGGRMVASRAGRTLVVDSDWSVSARIDLGGQVASAGAHEVLIAAEVAGVGTALDAYVTKLSADLTSIWRVDFTSSAPERPRAIVATPDGGAIVTGSGLGTLSLSPGGDVRWAIPLSGGDLAPTASGGALLVGGFLDEITLGLDHHASVTPAFFVCELDAAGAVVWSRAFSASYEANVDAVAIDPDGDVWLAGSFRGELELGRDHLKWLGKDPEPHLSGFVAELDPVGRPRHARPSDLETTFELVAAPGGLLLLTGTAAPTALLELRVLAPDGSELWRISGPPEIELGTGYGHDLAIDAAGAIAWSVDAHSVASGGAVLEPRLLKLSP